VKLFHLEIGDGIIDSRGVEAKRITLLIALVELTVILASLTMSIVSDTGASPTDSNLPCDDRTSVGCE